MNLEKIQILFNDIEELAVKWGLNNPDKQELKVLEEIGELSKSILENDLEEIKDGIGDLFITCLVLKKINGSKKIIQIFCK